MSSAYVCSNCAYESTQYLTACPICGHGARADAATYRPPTPPAARPAMYQPGAQAATYQPTAYGQPAPPTGEQRTCVKCDYETNQVVTKCPRCGRQMRTASTIRLLGWVLLLLGGFLVLFMGALSIFVVGAIYQSDQPGSTTRFNGGQDAVFFIFGIFGLVIFFGLAAIAGGLWQIIFGKRNKILIYIMLTIGLLLFLIGRIVRFLT